jgi:biofilm PGA synthesis N-glycosyltransferase PgaC
MLPERTIASGATDRACSPLPDEPARRPYPFARRRFAIATLVASAWTLFSIWIAQRWLIDLGALTHPLLALFAITFIAFVPGFMNAFLLASLVLDRRPTARGPHASPGVTVLISAYQEEAAIAATIASVGAQRYLGPVEILVLDDGSTDRTLERAQAAQERLRGSSSAVVKVLSFGRNRGKAAALNSGLERASHNLIVTVDGDTFLHPDALRNIVKRLLTSSPNTAAVAGAVLARNPHDSLIAGAQGWDYFHGIAAVKRLQSMYQGTLVAQGAFSIYRREALVEVGGWPDCVGEDIVLTWALLARDHHVDYAEDALVFTNVPVTVRQFALQRKRWARGMIEALHHHPGLLVKRRLSTMFIWWNLLFLALDLAYTCVFVPGLIAALFFQIHWIAGPLTLVVLPLAALWNLVIYRLQTRTMRRQGIRVRHSRSGFLVFLVGYTLLMQPICVWGYWSELIGRRKNWGTR